MGAAGISWQEAFGHPRLLRKRSRHPVSDGRIINVSGGPSNVSNGLGTSVFPRQPGSAVDPN